MAYAIMAGVPAINGLYVSFFNVLLYVLLGSSRHLSTGTYAIVSLIIISAIKRQSGVLFPKTDEPALTPKNSNSTTEPTTNYISNDPVEGAILLSMVLCFFVGITHVVLGMLHVGFVTKYLSDSIVNGLTCGSAYHVVTSQIGTLLGVTLKGTHLPVVLIGVSLYSYLFCFLLCQDFYSITFGHKDFIDIFSNITTINWATVIISVISSAFLYVIKVFVNERYKTKLPVPLPVELVLVIAATGISYGVGFKEKWRVNVIGDLKPG